MSAKRGKGRLSAAEDAAQETEINFEELTSSKKKRMKGQAQKKKVIESYCKSKVKGRRPL